MNVKLTTGEKLKDLRVEKGLTQEQLANEVHLSISTLSNYENDASVDISAANLLKIAEYYGVSTDYLLGRTEKRTGNLTEIEELHLDDETIEILKNEKINNRLLCEMIKDPGFIKTMTDIEIYVEGIAQTQINSLNVIVSVIRDQIIASFNPSEEDMHLTTLKAAEIDEDHYFTDLIHRDLDEMLGRIKKQQKNDEMTAIPNTIAEYVKNVLQEEDEFSASDYERKVGELCYKLGINYKALTPEEFQALIVILQKSKYLKYHTSRRGRKNKR